jgi:3-oxoacyl-[acyl-carrier protein] reductase
MRWLFDETQRVFDAPDVQVNNAGVYTEDEFHRLFSINVPCTILATKEAVKHFGPNGGSIISMSSLASDLLLRFFVNHPIEF